MTTPNYLDPANGYIAQQAQTELTRRENDITRQEMDEVAGANAASAGQCEHGGHGKCPAPGRWHHVSPPRQRSTNQLVSGLGAASAAARAAKRRELAKTEVSQGIGWQPQVASFQLGPVMAQRFIDFTPCLPFLQP